MKYQTVDKVEITTTHVELSKAHAVPFNILIDAK
jgi:hypothetical protein